MKKCECIGCNNIGSNQVKENETGNMVNVCDKHVATINQVSTMSSIFEDKNTSIEFYIATLRMQTIINLSQELSQRLKKYYPSETPEYLENAYKEIDDAFKHLIRSEAKFLEDLK